MTRLSFALCMGLCACGVTGQERVEVPVRAQGSQREFIDVDDARFTLHRADVGFGPLYLCGTQGADIDLCQVAMGELLETVTLSGLSAESRPLGTLFGTTGSVRSALYDYGISWLLTGRAPEASEGAPEGHSLVLEGSVTRGEQTLALTAHVDVRPRSAGDAAVNALGTRRELAKGDVLTLRVDPYRWLARIDLDQLFALDDDGDGQVTLREESQAYQAIRNGMTNLAPVTLEWSR